MDRLFFAVWPDADARAQLAALAVRLGRDHPARWVQPQRYHLTLAFLGSSARLDAALANAAMRAATNVRAAPFVWQPDRIRAFGGARPPCVLDARHACEPLQNLRRCLLGALANAGVGLIDTRPYAPHVTLGYGRGRVIAEQSVPPLDFRVRAFVLLHSRGGEPGYHELGRWPLLDAGGTDRGATVHARD